MDLGKLRSFKISDSAMEVRKERHKVSQFSNKFLPDAGIVHNEVFHLTNRFSLPDSFNSRIGKVV